MERKRAQTTRSQCLPAESWAGFANVNAELYPITLEEGGRISFLGSVADGGTADVRFRFEYKPMTRMTEPSYNTTSVTVSGADPVLYEIMLEPQGTNTYSSLIMYIDTRDVTVTITDVVVDFGTPPVFAVMTGVFDGFLADGDTYEFPTGAAEWAGVANRTLTCIRCTSARVVRSALGLLSQKVVRTRTSGSCSRLILIRTTILRWVLRMY